MQKSFISKTHFMQFIILYLIAHGGILFISQAIYWDDWTLFNMHPELILDMFKQAGAFGNFIGHLHVVLLSIGPWFYKIMVLGLIFFTGMFVLQILSKQDWINESERYYIVLFFLITPCVAARIALIDFPYILSVFFFFMAWSIMEKFRILALSLFFLSFITQSLLVFYLLPILDWYNRDLKNTAQNGSIRWVLSKIDFLILPFLWFAIKNVYFKPYGMYAGYNESYHWKNLISSPFIMLMDLLKVNINLPITLLIFGFFLFYKKMPKPQFSYKHNRMIYVGLFALLLAVFPYMILGLVPTFEEWSSRHQLLMPLGLSLIFVGLISLTESNDNRKTYIAFLIAISLFLNFKNYFDFFVDWKKQKSLVEFITHSKEIQTSSLILFDDKTSNALNRRYRFYEWNGILKLALNNEKNFGIYLTQLDQYNSGKFDADFKAIYSAADQIRTFDNRIVITIDKNNLKDVVFSHFPLYKYTTGHAS